MKKKNEKKDELMNLDVHDADSFAYFNPDYLIGNVDEIKEVFLILIIR